MQMINSQKVCAFYCLECGLPLVISSTWAHLIVSQNGSRFTFSHDFGHLLVTQLEATLEGHPVDVQVRTTKVDGETYFWPDSSSEDYIQRPTSIEGVCSYEVAMYDRKVLKLTYAGGHEK